MMRSSKSVSGADDSNNNKKQKQKKIGNKQKPVIIKRRNVEQLLDGLSSIAHASATREISSSRLEASGKSYCSSDDEDSLDSKSMAGGQYSVGSVSSSVVTSRTAREMIKEIQIRVAKNKNAPEYVPRLEELSPHHLSWNGKLAPLQGLRRERGQDPAVNILGCHFPIELILAKADKRARKQRKIATSKKVQDEIKIQNLDEMIKWKFSRDERTAVKAAHKERLTFWIQVVLINNYLSRLRAIYLRKKELTERSAMYTDNALIIKRVFLKWFFRHLFVKYELGFRKKLDKNLFHLKMAVRITRKRKMVAKLITFFKEFQPKQLQVYKVKTVIHRFCTAVRCVQSLAHSFIVCKWAKAEALRRLWDKLEVAYIVKKLEERSAKKAKNLSERKKTQKNNSDFDLFDAETKIVMKRQAKIWTSIDDKCVQKIVDLRLKKFIKPDESLVQQAEKLMMPYELKIRIILSIIDQLRKDFFARAAMTKAQKLIETGKYDQENARALLIGGEESRKELQEKINEKLDKNLVKMNYEPFNLFALLDRKPMHEAIQEYHAKSETFVIKLNIRGEDGGARKATTIKKIFGRVTKTNPLSPRNAKNNSVVMRNDSYVPVRVGSKLELELDRAMRQVGIDLDE